MIGKAAEDLMCVSLDRFSQIGTRTGNFALAANPTEGQFVTGQSAR
jgi:hypothetical protein